MPEVLLLHTEHCGRENTEAAREALERALGKRGVSPDSYKEIEIRTAEEARDYGFVGGPAVTVDGVDVDPAVRDMTPGGLGCRAYVVQSRIYSAPPEDMIIAALEEADAGNG